MRYDLYTCYECWRVFYDVYSQWAGKCPACTNAEADR